MCQYPRENFGGRPSLLLMGRSGVLGQLEKMSKPKNLNFRAFGVIFFAVYYTEKIFGFRGFTLFQFWKNIFSFSLEYIYFFI